MIKYHKIQTVFLRDPETEYKTLVEGQFAKPEFEYLQNITWLYTEKVDGMNIRIDWSTNIRNVSFAGRTDNTSIPLFLFEKLLEIFTEDKFVALYSKTPMTLYGEGYGARIQKGGRNYISDGVDFILFDVMINGNFLERKDVEDIANKLGIKIVPIIASVKLSDAVNMVNKVYKSQLRDTPPEGFVMRPIIELKNRRGERIITKIKLKDFK